MALRVSTTTADVLLHDLGILIVHPTNNRDLVLEFSSDELRESNSLTTAIQNGDLIVDDGQFTIASTDYDPNEVANQELGLKLDRRFVSYAELGAGHQDTHIVESVFPVALNSTAATTRNVYAPGAKWGTWQIDVGDIVVISGSTAADGTYTVESITDSQNFIVVESISDSTGGNLSVYHPAASKQIGVDTTNFDAIVGSSLQAALDSIDDQLGATVAGHRGLDQLVHNIAENAHKEYLYTGNKVTSVITWTDNNKTTKIRELQFSYSGYRAQTIIMIQYDSNGTEVERLTKTLTYTNNRITSIDEVLT